MSLNVVMSLCSTEYLSVLERSGDGCPESPFDPLSPHPISLRTQEQRGYGSAPGCMFISLTKYPCMHVCILPSFPTHFILRSYWRISRHPESKSPVVSIQSAPKCTHRDLVFAVSISSWLS